MSILNDRKIQLLAESLQMLVPFSRSHLNSFGYDLTLSTKFLIPVPNYLEGTIVDPLSIEGVTFREFEGDHCVIPPNSFILGCSREFLTMPPNVTGICMGRSSYARCGIISNVTPLEAGWKGVVTIEISNSNRLPAKVHADLGIVQVVFFEGDLPERTYTQRGGRYQDQKGITLPRGL